MPKRDGLASNLLEVARLRSPVSIAALRDLVTLCLKEKEVEARPGLESEKYSCSQHSSEQKLRRPNFSVTAIASN
jgi:hypothetical protein